MTVEASVYTLGVPLISLVIWQMHRANIRLSEIQREVSGLRDLISRLFLTARNEKPEAASRGSKVPFVDHQQLEPQSLQQGAYDTATALRRSLSKVNPPGRHRLLRSAARDRIRVGPRRCTLCQVDHASSSERGAVPDRQARLQ